MRLFNRKNIFLYCVLYFILTIGVSLYNLFKGVVHDPLGYYHEIYRAIFLFLVMALIDAIKNFSLKKGLINSLLEFWPLLLGLGLYALAEYKRGKLPLNLLKDYLWKFLIGLILLLLLIGILSTILKMLSSAKKIYFSITGLLYSLLLLSPAIIWLLVKGKNNTLYYLFTSRVYLIALIFFGLLIFTFLLTNTLKIRIDAVTIVFLVFYYICFTVLFFVEAKFYLVALLELCFFISTIAYSSNNRLSTSVVLSFIYYVLILLGSLMFYKPF
ncbi:MAG: hypothetical protein Q4B60_04235 [Erysipelotrichaceae bacterium]|nr:hypothetical protein [Erysipelotrichaceae bacterium]